MTDQTMPVVQETLFLELEKARYISSRYPSHGDPFTSRTVAAARYYLDIDEISKPTHDLSSCEQRSYIVNSQLGYLGRFGNQILQYGACRVLEAISGAIFLYRTWSGSVFFKYAEATMSEVTLDSHALPIIDADRIPVDKLLRDLKAPGIHEIRGYFGAYPNHLADYKSIFKDSFSYKLSVETALLKTKYQDIGPEDQYLAVHVRKGDFSGNLSLDTPMNVYFQSIESILSKHTKLRLVLLTDDDTVKEEFKVRFGSLVVQPASFVSPDLQFVYDHYLIRTASHVLLAPNSTFSHTAALLSESSMGTFLPKVDGVDMVDPWTGKIIEAYH